MVTPRAQPLLLLWVLHLPHLDQHLLLQSTQHMAPQHQQHPQQQQQ